MENKEMPKSYSMDLQKQEFQYLEENNRPLA
jgi:hypothetical protein